MDIEVSIIMPAYNAQDFIAETITSVQTQTFKNWELIIVDDGSTDATSAIIADFQHNDNRIKYIHQLNRKQAAARNKGILQANGKWIAFLDADDQWLTNKLESQFKYITDISADVFYSQGYIINESDKIISDFQTTPGYHTSNEVYKKLYEGNHIPILSVIVKKEWVNKIGDQDEDPKIVGCEDLDYWLRLAKAGANFYGIESKLFKYRMNPNGTSRKILQMKIAECCALFNNYDPSCFNTSEIRNVQFRFIVLIRSIIPALYLTKNKEAIKFFFSLIYQITGSFKYRASNFFFNILGYNSKRAVTFLLFH